MTLNDIAADRQQWRNLTAASMAQISWTMNTWRLFQDPFAGFPLELCNAEWAHKNYNDGANGSRKSLMTYLSFGYNT